MDPEKQNTRHDLYKEVKFDPPETPNVITAPMKKHDKCISAIEDVLYVASISYVVTPLSTIKENLLQASLFSGCIKECYCCTVQPNGCRLLKEGVQRLMDEHVILIEKVLYAENLC